MSEFEKQFSYPEFTGNVRDDLEANDVYEGEKRGWKAALEWVLVHYKRHDMDDWDYTACIIKENIEKELEELE